MFHTLQVLAAHPELNNIIALQLSRAFSLISCLKRDITIPQPLSEAPECPPTFLPPAIAEFLAESPFDIAGPYEEPMGDCKRGSMGGITAGRAKDVSDKLRTCV
ncbi:hypothetical protein BDN70DRAFT_882715 [Pholiota conissans]|uniref:Uncharacterized protein n=1 Tax=Pholiota conissans TaxID=109636 RepID=A0A9P6CY28_9AGAR|nr:hypothetical protein BDN70DRAFT_882715 [Pholiota conissans]